MRHGCEVDEAENYAKDNTDVSINFMSLDGTETSRVWDQSNSGEFNVAQIDEHGSSVAAHEYGHMLGYYINKTHKDGTVNVSQDGTFSHAWRGQGEDDYIMGGYNGATPRVHAVEYSRLNGGRQERSQEENKSRSTGFGGLFTPRGISNVSIVNPKKPLTNIVK